MCQLVILWTVCLCLVHMYLIVCVCGGGNLLLNMAFYEQGHKLCRWPSVEDLGCGVDVNTLRFYS